MVMKLRRGLGLTAVVLLLVGFGFKVSMVPFHQWAPDTYEGGPHEETIELRLRQWINTFKVERVLRSQQKKVLRQLVCLTIQRDHTLLHGLKQRGLRLWPGTVNFINQYNISKKRPRQQLEAVTLLVEYMNTR